MKLTLLAPLLLSSTAFAGVGRWSRRQDAIVICRPGVAGDCAAGQRCQYATRNPVQIGYDGACVADTSSASSSSVAPASSISSAPAPGPSVVICRDDADCTSAERCQFVTRNPERPGYDGACVARGTGSSSSAGPAPSNGACTVNTDCPATQFCDSSASTGPSTCVNYRDCRMNGCPGGTCVAQNSGPTVDPRNPNEPFQCNFTIPASSSAPVSSASASVSASVSGSISSASNSASATSSAPSGVPSVVICANDNECSKTQFCKYVTRNPDGSGKNGACTEFSDCRGRIGCGSDKGAQICAPPANNPTVYYKDPTVNFTCVASLPSSSVQPSSSSGPTGSSVHPTSQVGPTESAHPPPPPPASSKAAENSPAPPAPPASSKAAEYPPAPPAPAPPAPPASSSAAPAPAPPAPPAPSKSAAPPAPPAGKCKADYAEILKLLYEIKGEVECVKKDVEDLKSKLNA